VAPCEITRSTLPELLPKAIGGILIRSTGSDPVLRLQELDRELSNRLSFPWMLPEPPSRRRVAWVQGREDIESSQRAYEAARALGISLVMIENAGHWLEDGNGPHAHLREAFIAVNIEVDDEFPQRIASAVRGYPHPVDGVMTISDVRLPGVAKACEILGLPTSPYDAYAIAGDKAKTRMLEFATDEVFILSSAEDLPEYLSNCQARPLPFPMIVKPCLGWSSDCVAKVSNEAELADAVLKASNRHAGAPKPSTAVIVEPYVDGPEVDANFVLLDGELLFADINDDFPSRGDADDASHEDSFQETQNVMPTALPGNEIATLRDSLHKSILRQGFSSGVFHCEARVRHSRVHYSTRDGILDLEEKKQPSSREVSVYLLEINARPPGYLETVAVLLTYGVDYYALQLLLCVGSAEIPRIRALSQPFVNGAQFHLSAMIIPQTCAGVMKTADAGAEFLLRHRQLRDQIPDYKTTKKGGDILEGPSASSLWWIAYFSIFSRSSRQDCLRLVQFIKENFSYEVC
jgi:biotin carboxylase